MKIAVLGNVTPDFFVQDFRRAGNEVYLSPGFDAWRQEALDLASGLRAFAPDLARLSAETPGFWDARWRGSTVSKRRKTVRFAPSSPKSTSAAR